MATATTAAISTTNAAKSIRQLLQHVDQDQLVLPEIQREFVWTRKAVKLLFDSLYRGLPIGHILVWKAATAVTTRDYEHHRLRRGMRLANFYGYLLDGQQRLTAIAHVRDADEDYPLMFYAWPERDPDNVFYWRGKNEDFDPWCIPISEALSDDFNVTERLAVMRGTAEFKPEYEESIRRDLERLHAILNYTVGIIEWESDDYKLATVLFVRFNSTGRKLRSSDLNIAQLAITVPGLVSREIQRTREMWRDFHFTSPYIVQCLLAVHTRRLQHSDPERFWEDESPADIRASWKKTQRAFGEVVNFLTATVRWQSSTLIPSFNALVPLVYLLAANGSWSSEERLLARRWLLLALVHRYFSGSVQTQLDGILRKLGNRPSMKRLWNITHRRLRRLQSDDFDTSRLSGPIMSVYLSMLRNSDARDWRNHDVRLDGTVTGQGAQLQIHHFFPRALLRKRDDLTMREINTFANYSVISADANLNVGTEEPATYIERLKIPEKELEKQCIPMDRELWRASRYRDFLRQRRRLLAKTTNEFLQL
jgi:hypothetical protein